MITGYVNRAREPVVELSLVGSGNPIEAIVDTGFTGALLISQAVADQAQLQIRATEYFTLADGSTATALIARGSVIWFDRERTVDILVAEASDVLLGVELLEGCRLVIDFDSNDVSISQGAVEGE